MGDVEVERISGNTYRVTATAKNPKAIPSRADAARRNRIGQPDFFSIEGSNLTVIAGGFPSGPLQEQLNTVERRPGKLSIDVGIQGIGSVTVSWIVSGRGEVTITYESTKGGTVSSTIELR